MFGIRRGKPGATSNLVVKIFVTHGEERIPGQPEHRVVQHRPFRRITASHWKRATLKGHVFGWVIDRIFHVHVPSLGRAVDFVVKLVRPGADNLLEIVVAEFAVVERVVAGRRSNPSGSAPSIESSPSGWLIAGIFLPKRNIGSIGKPGLDRPLIVDLRRREDSRLSVVIESVKERMRRH